MLKINAPATMPVQARRLKKLAEAVLGWSLETETEFNLDDEVGTATYNWTSYRLKLVFRKLQFPQKDEARSMSFQWESLEFFFIFGTSLSLGLMQRNCSCMFVVPLQYAPVVVSEEEAMLVESQDIEGIVFRLSWNIVKETTQQITETGAKLEKFDNSSGFCIFGQDDGELTTQVMKIISSVSCVQCNQFSGIFGPMALTLWNS